MQPTDQDKEESFNEAVEVYRNGGRQEKKYIPNSSVQEATHIAANMGSFDPNTLLPQTPQVQPLPTASSIKTEFDTLLNPFSTQIQPSSNSTAFDPTLPGVSR